MQAKFLDYNNQLVREAEIDADSFWGAPRIISFEDKFFERKRITSKNQILVYAETYGKFLSNIELVKLVKGVKARDL